MSSTLTVTTTASSPCANLNSRFYYSVHGPCNCHRVSNIHTFTITIYVYGHADITKDGVVNIVDLAIVQANLDKLVATQRTPKLDVSNDGRIDVVDWRVSGSTFGVTC